MSDKRSFSFTVHATPVAQPRHRVGVINGAARVFEAKRTHPIHQFKHEVRQAAYKAIAGESPIAKGVPVEVLLLVVLPFAGQPRKRNPIDQTWRAKKPDIDNLVKSVFDALNGVLWHDDSQVAVLSVRKMTAGQDGAAIVAVTASELSDVEDA